MTDFDQQILLVMLDDPDLRIDLIRYHFGWFGVIFYYSLIIWVVREHARTTNY